jgi:hypothetical protein
VDLRISVESLRTAGTGLQAAGGRFATALEQFRAELAGHGEPWGTDDVGSLIGAAHAEVSDFAFECYADARDEVIASGEDLVGMAERYDVLEKDNLALMTAMDPAAGA